MNNRKRFIYGSGNDSRRLVPTTVKYFYKLDGKIEITFDVDQKVVKFVYAPECKFITFTLSGFREFLDFLTDNVFLYGYDATDYLPDDNCASTMGRL